jgi:acetyl-CoA synthetase
MTLKEMLVCFVILKETEKLEIKKNLYKEINQHISGSRPIAKLDKIQFVSGLPKHVLEKL